MFPSKAFLLVAVAAALLGSGCGGTPPAATEKPASPTVVYNYSKSLTVGASGKKVREAVMQTVADQLWTAEQNATSNTDGVLIAKSPGGQQIRISYQVQGENATELKVFAARGTPENTADDFFQKIVALAVKNP